MSLTPCAHGRGKRPDAVTCAERCDRFPACLYGDTPSASPQLRDQIASTFRAGAVERTTITILLAMLEAALGDDDDEGVR